MNVKKIARKILRIALWLFLSIGALLLLVIGLLQIPAVQHRITDQLEKSLSKKLNTEVNIGKVGIDFPKLFTIEEVYLETPAGDSLFSLGKLGVDLDMIRLFHKEIQIQKVKIEDIFADIIITDTTSNILFLLDAFVKADTSSSQSQTPPSPAKDSSAASWVINLPNTVFQLDRADIYYQDDPNGLLLDGKLERFRLSTQNIDLKKQIYALDKVSLNGGNVLLGLKETKHTPDTTSVAPMQKMQIRAKSLSVEDTKFTMQSDPMDLLVHLPESRLENAQLLLQDSIQFQATDFTVLNGRYAMDLPAPGLNAGFDLNHMDLTAINIEAHDIQYAPDAIIGRIDLAQAVDQSGLSLNNLSGKIYYQPDQLKIQELQLATNRSTIAIPSFLIQYNFQEPFHPLAALKVDSEVAIKLAVEDILFMLPKLDSIDILRRNQDQYLEIDLIAAGNQQTLNLDRILVDAPGLEFRGSGVVHKILDTETLRGNLSLTNLFIRPAGVFPLLPDSLLPAYINWPDQLRINGNLQYTSDIASFNLRAEEQRDSSSINSVLAVSGQVKNIRQYPSSSLDLTIDTLRATRFSALAYLPENSIPAGYNLPDFLKGNGKVQGAINNLNIDIQVLTKSERTRIAVNGAVNQILNPDSLQFDLNIPQLLIDISELSEILPDSTLPSDLNIPDFRITDGAIAGRLKDLDFNLPIKTINGDGILEGHYATENFNIFAEIDNFRPEDLYQGARSDSLALLALAPLRIEVNSSGKLTPNLDAELQLTVFEGAEGALVDLKGTAIRDTFYGKMTFSHSDLQGTATTTFIQKDSLQEIEGSVRIKRADLERWRLSDRPLYLSGSSKFSSKGLSLDDLSARLSMNDILLRSDTSSAFVDSLFAYAEMHDGNNEIEIFSDLLNFSLEGSFRPALVFGEISRFIRAYWQEEIEQPDPVVYGNYLSAYLEIRNPRPLTSGIIPGLRRLSPMSANFIYRERDPELLLTASLPLLNYAGIKMDSLKLDTRGSKGKIQYQADWKKINLFNQIILAKTQIKGQNEQGALGGNFQVWNEDGSLQHHIQMRVDPEEDSLSLQLGPEQLIDNIIWKIPANNRLLVSGKNIQADHWKLSYKDQSIMLQTPSSKELLVQLDAINLAPFSKLIRSEEEIFVGVLNGAVKVTDPLNNLRFDAQVDVRDLSVYSKLWGNLSLDIANRKAETYKLDLQLSEAVNLLSVTGTFVPDGVLDLKIDIGTLLLETMEPLSLGYLSNAQGHIEGQVNIGGNFSRPSYQGQLRFVDAAIDVALLKTRFRIEDEPIRFQGQAISLNNLSFYDPQGNEAILSGSVTAKSLTNYAFDLSARARDFLVLNTTKEDNDLYYGYLRADADVDIGGDIYQPILEVTASPKKGSSLTYNLIQNAVPQAESRRGVVRFIEAYEWQQTIVADSLEQMESGQSKGFDLITNLNVNAGLNFTVIIDPVTGDQFSGSGEGDIVFHQFPDGGMEMTGRVEMVKGIYDFTYQGLISRQFKVESGSSISWQGDPMNPNLDLTISSYIQASPLPLVNEFGGGTESNLRRKQTFAVQMYLDGTLEGMQVNTNIIYPDDISGNSGQPAIEQSLSTLRTDQSQLNTQAFGLLLFKGFVNFGDSGASPGGGIDNSVQSGLDNVLSQQLNNLANRYINFVELDFGMESFNNSQGGRQRDLRLSLRKRLFNDRLIVSIDGVTQTGETDDDSTLPQTYLDNLTAEFLLSKNGGLRLKVFSDRELDQFTTGDVVRVGGRLAFSKDFDHFFWSSNKKPSKAPTEDQPKPKAATRNGEQKIQIEKE